MEQFSSQVNKYSKYVNQLEKGLPRNNIVPCLKNKVDMMMHRVGRKKCYEISDIFCVIDNVVSSLFLKSCHIKIWAESNGLFL